MTRPPRKLTADEEAFVTAVMRELDRLEAERDLPTQDEQDLADLTAFLEP